MFVVGDKIIYPLHGVGDIVESKVVNELEYIVIAIPAERLYIQMPKKQIEEVGIRKPETKEQMEETLIQVGRRSLESSKKWKIRHQENLSKLKIGTVQEVAEVLKILMDFAEKRKLSYVESRMYALAKQVILSEMSLVCETNTKNAEELLAKWMKN